MSNHLRTRAGARLYLSGAVIVVIVLACAAAPLLAPYGPLTQDLFHTLTGPSSAHLLGTDSLGRDVLSRLLWGGRPTLLGVGEALVVAILVGIPTGLLAGYHDGLVDGVISRTAEVLMAVPVLILVLVVVGIFPTNSLVIYGALGFLLSPPVMRVVRSATQNVRHELYVDAARVAGLSTTELLTTEIAPRIVGPIVVQLSLLASTALLVGAGLAFLGFGVQPPNPTWGSMVADAQANLQQQPWLLVPTGGVIAITVVAFLIFGDAVRDAAVAGQSTTRPKSKLRRRDAMPALTGSETLAAVHPGSHETERILEVADLEVSLAGDRDARILDGVTFSIGRGELVGIVGETGCGKSVTVRAAASLLRPELAVIGGSVTVNGRPTLGLSSSEIRKIRGREIGFVSQDPLRGLDPSLRVGSVLAEVVAQTTGRSRRAARERVRELLQMVGLADDVAYRFPHEISGGMAQRIAIAIALAGEPDILIADEPTTALDVTVQAGILDLFRRLSADRGLAIILVTHDLGVVADLCDRVLVMYAGRVVEDTGVFALFDTPSHPYTRALLAANPQQLSEGRLAAIPGSVPAIGEWPSGCAFRNRCQFATQECGLGRIPLVEVGENHSARCIHTESATAAAIPAHHGADANKGDYS
jgi:peptide/nickel transport system permease protein